MTTSGLNLQGTSQEPNLANLSVMASSPSVEEDPPSDSKLEDKSENKMATSKPVLLREEDDDGLRATDDASVRSGEDVLALQDLDPVLNLKMHLVNNVSRHLLVIFRANVSNRAVLGWRVRNIPTHCKAVRADEI